MRRFFTALSAGLIVNGFAFQPAVVSPPTHDSRSFSLTSITTTSSTPLSVESLSRRDWLSAGASTTVGALTVGSFPSMIHPEPAQAVGPVKINLLTHPIWYVPIRRIN